MAALKVINTYMYSFNQEFDISSLLAERGAALKTRKSIQQTQVFLSYEHIARLHEDLKKDLPL